MSEEKAPSLPSTASPPPHKQSLIARVNTHLQTAVVPTSPGTTWAMAFASFMTGYTSAVSFTACYIWAGFQTGGTIQLGLALARLFSTPKPRDYTFQHPDQQALTSLLSFILGTSLGRLGDKIGPKKRVWLVSASLVQALCMLAAALCAKFSGETGFADSRGEPSWITPLGLAALGFASASLGIQGIIGKRLNTQFATALVLTTIWVELINDPLLFARKHVKSRDHKAFGIFACFLGGLLGRALLDKTSSAATLGVGAGLRVLGGVAWWFIAGESEKKKDVEAK
ncbi:hypothetical protein MNV49_000207 [Pseudohyphozyma bogoriensis]|nr:hypothetical protein MNV49_000207 [Pseudohyphozyma bogoriensis]